MSEDTTNPNIKVLSIKDVLEPDIRAIDVVVWGGSRPDIFKVTIESFMFHIKFSGRLRYFLEDGDFDNGKALESKRLAEEYGFSGVNIEKVGSYAWAQTHAMDRWVTSPYMFSLEDDWECLRDTPLDDAYDLMETHDGINQIRFNKRGTEKKKGQVPCVWTTYDKEYVLEGKKFFLTVGNNWTTIPALWKMSFIRPRWEGKKDRGYWWISAPDGPLCRGLEYPKDYESLTPFVEKVLGTYIWGPIGEPPFFKHIGSGEFSIRHKQDNEVLV